MNHIDYHLILNSNCIYIFPYSRDLFNNVFFLTNNKSTKRTKSTSDGELSESILQRLELGRQIVEKKSNLVLGVEHFNAVCVRIVPDAKRTRNRCRIFSGIE